ncbi:hypothetical protein WOLCODRAFT_164576 [Wolfiporia cocos MD-104 SS10]|uniref:DASH complex subunit DUO1 n=1 Tax=Wolfiporia cocos (strain MD-104) TaxID=742152 RepID=A0A2H3JN47_WOLCO|nr:hypothetical protein WOLCODRAFT_164576 [Wolfiporia cocos MD-104 SS10]
MDSPNISELNFLQGNSRLMSESSLSSSSSRTGPGGDDLSLSELSLSDRPAPSRRPKFSLLAQPRQEEPSYADESAIAEDDAEYTAEGTLDETMTQEDVEKAKKEAARTREEKLQHDLFILKKLNGAFEVYKEALRETKSSTERVAAQLAHTDALLDKYVKILSKSENVARLIMDERWQGAEMDEEILEREEQEALQRARREEEERRLAAQRERERQEREEQERRDREERERLERERAEAVKAAGRGSGVRGVRGTRASMRGVRGVPRAASTASTRGGRATVTTAIKRPSPSGSSRLPSAIGSTRGITRRD